MGLKFSTIYRNDFDDGVIAPLVFQDFTGLGNASEAGTQLTLNQLGGNYNWSFNRNPANVYYTDPTYGNFIDRWEMKIDSLTIGSGCQCGMLLGPSLINRALFFHVYHSSVDGLYYVGVRRYVASTSPVDIRVLLGADCSDLAPVLRAP